MNKNNGCGTYLIIVIIIFFLFCVIKTCLEPSASEQWYQDHKEEIDRCNTLDQLFKVWKKAQIDECDESFKKTYF